MIYIIGFIILIITLIGFIYSRSKAGPRREYTVDLSDKIIIITGASAGIGKETARKLANHRGTIVFACRDREKTERIIKNIHMSTKSNNLYFIQLNLSDYDSVRQFVVEFKQKFTRCDILICNAGIFLPSVQFNKLHQELVLATNHLGHFLLTYLLLDMFPNKSRIINVASGAHEFLSKEPDFNKALTGELGAGFTAYSCSKFANVVFTQQLQHRFDEQHRDIKVVSVHPGFVRSEIYHSKNSSSVILSSIARAVIFLFRQFSLTEKQGSWTTVYTALQAYEGLVPGAYYQKNRLSSASRLARECTFNIWDWSLQAVSQ